MFNKYHWNYIEAYARYKMERPDMSEKDREFCARVEQFAYIGRDVVTTVVTAPVVAAVGVGIVTGWVLTQIWDQTKKSYNEYVKENGTRI